MAVLFLNQDNLLPHVQGGKLRALAVASEKRNPAYPDVPTVAESGYPGFAAESWFGLSAPAGTPPEAIERLHQATVKALGTPEMRQKLESVGFVVVGSSPAEFSAFVPSSMVIAPVAAVTSIAPAPVVMLAFWWTTLPSMSMAPEPEETLAPRVMTPLVPMAVRVTEPEPAAEMVAPVRFSMSPLVTTMLTAPVVLELLTPLLTTSRPLVSRISILPPLALLRGRQSGVVRHRSSYLG